MDAFPTTNPRLQIDVLELTSNAVALMELQAPAAFRDALVAEVFPADLHQSLERTKNGLGVIIASLSHPSLGAIRKDADALFEALEKVCTEISQLNSVADRSHDFQVLCADNLNQSAQEIVRVCGNLRQSLNEAIDSSPHPESPANFFTRFLAQFQLDLERRYPSTLEERILAHNARNLALALIPGVGLAAEIISAQGRFARAVANDDSELRESARRELVNVLLIQCLALASNGDSSVIKAAFKGASIASLLRVMTNDTQFETDFLGPISGIFLKVPGITSATDAVLASSLPDIASELSYMYSNFNVAFKRRFG